MPDLRTVPVPDAWGDTYTRRSKGTDSTAECVRCGRKLNGRTGYLVHLIAGNNLALHHADEGAYTDDGGDMGWWGLGADCASVVPADYRHKITDLGPAE